MPGFASQPPRARRCRRHDLLRRLALPPLLLAAGLLAKTDGDAGAVAPQGVKTESTPFIRTTTAMRHLRVDPKGRFIAYIEGDGKLGLNVLDSKTQAIWRASDAQVGASFFWSPDGYRLFYRELMNGLDGKVHSVLKTFDCALARSVVVEDLPFQTGILTFDPRDLRMHLLGPKGIRTKRIYFPDERLAKWQVAQRRETGKFLATQSGVLWVTQGGYAMRRLDDDGTDLESFDISPDGTTIAWATAGGRVYSSKDGAKPVFIGHGRDPNWHADKTWLVYAGARMVGTKAVNYDVRIADARDGNGRFLTSSQFIDERWPQWHPKADQILYTIDRSTDIFVLDFKL